ncbi:MAG: molybdenum cofactor guanylyltransferase [Candidatus Brocadiae bacterium]|nr:molybdenum cofactor guanylyltransferase [Candidatus Brocadiia bacterium]
MEISAAVLAGGLSTRFPADKMQLQIQGENIVYHNVRLLRGLFPEVFVVANQKNRIPGLEEECIVDIYPKTGPLGAIYTALSFSKSPWVFTLAGDMPFMTLDYIQWAISQIPEDADAVIPKDKKGHQPLSAFYNKSCIQVIEKNLHSGIYKILAICSEISYKELDVFSFPQIHQNPYLFYNINTQEDWEKYLVFQNSFG